jgi:hypothetical protein
VRGGCGRAGDDFFGADESAAGKVAGGYCLSREEDYILFSAGDFGGGERGVVDFDVSGGAVEAVSRVRAFLGAPAEAFDRERR